MVVLAAIGALAYFGVLSPCRFLPSDNLGACPSDFRPTIDTCTRWSCDMRTEEGILLPNVVSSQSCEVVTPPAWTLETSVCEQWKRPNNTTGWVHS